MEKEFGPGLTLTATYSPEDNKLRLYSSTRLDKETYERVRAYGFIWAPKQELFVAPSWTPEREEFLIDLCGEIGDEDTSLVDRAEQRAERFEDYSDSRQDDAERAREAVSAIADNIPLGQPILVGHHSERHARRDAEKIENGMRRAVKMWETAEYWKDRAAGAIGHAKYKELPAVRARRIKGLEADKRSHERDIERAERFTKAWSVSLEWDPEVRRLTREQARAIANYDHACSSMCYPLKDYPRNPPASQYEGAMGLWSALGDTDEQAIITPEQARDFALRSHAATIRHANRWLQHINNRLAYERAMLAEGGGLKADGFDIKIGGQVKRRGQWFVVVKLNKRNGTLNSVTVSGHWASTIPMEDIQDYQPPAEGDAEKVEARMKQAPLCNFRSEGCIEMTSAEWKEKSKWGDAWAVRRFDAKGEYIWRGETLYRHRSRYSLGSSHSDKVVRVFLTDSKVVEPPTTAPVKPEPVERKVETREDRSARRAKSLDDLHEIMFYKRESGTIRAGVKYEYPGEGWSECYQFSTVEELREYGRNSEAQPRLLRYKIVTYSGPSYEGMATVYEWERNAELFESMKDSLRAGVQVVSAPQLFPTPPELAARMVEEAGGSDLAMRRVLEPSVGTGNIVAAVREVSKSVPITAIEINSSLAETVRARFDIPVIAGDFLEQNGNLGLFDAIIMNPPFANADDIRHIQHAEKFLKPGGRLVAICANGPRQQEKLKPWIEERGGFWEDLPAGTFKEQGTGVNVALVVIPGA